jgi:hypothetical protein
MVVEGYAIEGEGDAQFVDRLLGRVEQGFRRIKIEAGHYGNSEALPRRLAEFRRQAGHQCRLVLDFAWSWECAQSNLQLARRVASYTLDWLEDPLERSLLHEYRLLRQQSGRQESRYIGPRRHLAGPSVRLASANHPTRFPGGVFYCCHELGAD